MARTLTGLNAQQEVRTQAVILDRLVIQYQKRIGNEISRAMRQSADKYDPDNTTALAGAMADHRARMTVILYSLWRESGKAMAEHVAGVKKSYFGQEQKAVDADQVIPPTEVADRVMQSWIASEGGQQIVQITKTTERDINRAISAGIEAGKSQREIAKAIRAAAPIIGGSRSETIARTETHSAANVAAQATAKASGLKMVREWCASKGNRTRKTHADADGQQVGMNEKFIVGGAQLRWPGDQQAGRPAETINCRCAVLYVFAKRV